MELPNKRLLLLLMRKCVAYRLFQLCEFNDNFP